MSRKQLLLLASGILVPWTVGHGLLPILPIYAIELGASEAIAGYYLAISFLALAVGTVLTGWLADKFQRRKLLLGISAVIMMPSLWLMGEVNNVWQLTGVTAVVWFTVGMASSIVTILAGLFAGKHERGRVMGIIGMTPGFAGIIGGLSVGPMVDRWGYPPMFMAFCFFAILLLTIAFFVKDKKVDEFADTTTMAKTQKTNLGKAFFILLLAQTIVGLTSALATMGRSLSMKNLEFAATAISSTGVVSGLVSLPFPFVLGWLSDRLGRKSMMIACYAVSALCLVTLAISTSLWHFWIVMLFFRVGHVSRSVGSAFVADLVKSKVLGRGVSLFQGMVWIAFTIGYAVGGITFQNFGIAATSFIGAALPAIGIILIMLIRVTKQKEAVAAGRDVA